MAEPKNRQYLSFHCRKFSALRVVVVCFFLSLTVNLRADQFDLLRNYWLSQLTGTNVSVSTLTSRAITASNYWNTMNTGPARTSLWSNLPLGSVSANITSTFSQLEAMALAWATPGCSLQGNTNLAAAVTGGLDWMCANCYTTSATEYNNWWDWQIGGMQNFNNVGVLIYPALTAAQITNYNNSVNYFSPDNSSGNLGKAPNNGWLTGANLTDQCKGMFINAIIGKNGGQMTDAQTNLSPVFLYVTSSDGFYRDGSFVQHTHIAYTGSYGIVLLGDVAQLANLLNGSTWQITDPNLTNVYNWVANSFEPLIYHGTMMDMVRGRAISRYGETEASDGSSVVSDVQQIAQFAPPATAVAFTNWAASPAEPPGQYQFADMDRVVSWRSNFCFGLSMSSSRIANYESINGENLHGWFTGDGMTYLYLGNPETQFTGDFWPTVDAYHLPGTTVETNPRANSANEATTTGQTWAGGAQAANSYGTAGMSLAAVATTLTAKKSWFMFDNEIVCLGAGITCGGTNEIDTTVEDRRLGTSPTNNFTVNGAVHPPTIGWSSNLTSASWCALDGVAGYYFPGGATNLHAAFTASTGAWSNINNGTYVATTTNLYTDDYLTLWFNHGIEPTNSTYAYVILPTATASGMSAYAASPDVVVLANTPLVQAASKPSLGIVAANFWTNGNYSADLITVNKKSSVITSESPLGISAGISDPTQTNTSTITVTLNRSAIATASADPGVTVVQLSPQIIFTVNVNGSLGKTYQAAFIYAAASLTWDANTLTAGTQDGSGIWDSGTNWWNGTGDVSWNDTLSYLAVFGAGGAAGNVTLPGSHNAYALIFNPVASGAYLLAGTGTLSISSGITANALATVNVPLNLPASQTWTVATNQILNVGGTISAPSPVALSLAGAGTVNLSGSNQISTDITAINFTDTANKTTLAVAANTQTVAALNLGDGVTAAVLGGGALLVNGAANFTVGGATTGAAQTLDLSGLNNFVCNVANNNFSVGGQANSVAGSGTVYLAATNAITAGTFGVQTVTGSTSAQSSGNLYLGQNTSINANTLTVGLTRDNGVIRFKSGAANPMLAIRASDGASRANITVGTRSSSYSATATGLVDLTTNVNGTSALDALVGTLQIANEGYCLTASDVLNGILVMGGGTLDATNIIIGSKSSTTGQSLGIVNGIFTQGGGTVKVAALMLGDKTAGNTGTLNATYNLDGGMLSAQTITPGANTATRNFNWPNGTIGNYDASTDLTIAAGLNLILNPAGTEIFTIGAGRTGTVNSIISGAGSPVKNGGGTLALAATNLYTGTTTVSTGTLLVNGAIGTNTVTVAAGATLGGTGTVNGVATVQAGGAVQNSAGNFSVATLNLGNSGAAMTYSQFMVAAGGKISAADLNVSGTNIVNILDGSLAAGTNTLFTYTGAIGGSSGFGGFKLGTVPANGVASLRNTGSAVQLVVTSLVMVNPNPPVLTNAISGNTLALSWPADHLGWRLEAQTNSLSVGLKSNWFTWPDSTNMTSVPITINPAQPTVFFRLVYP